MVEIKLMDDIVSGPLQLGHNRGNELASFMVRQYCGTTLCTQYCLTMDDASSVPLFAPQVVHAKHAAETDNAFTGVSAVCLLILHDLLCTRLYATVVALFTCRPNGFCGL